MHTVVRSGYTVVRAGPTSAALFSVDELEPPSARDVES